MAGAHPGCREDCVRGQAERQARARAGGALKTILGIEFFFSFFQEKPLHSFLSMEEYAQTLTHFGSCVKHRLEGMAKCTLSHTPPTALCYSCFMTSIAFTFVMLICLILCIVVLCEHVLLPC